MSFLYLQFSQKTNEKIWLYYYGTSSRIVFVNFLGELKPPKRHFEINWPLCTSFWENASFSFGYRVVFLSTVAINRKVWDTYDYTLKMLKEIMSSKKELKLFWRISVSHFGTGYSFSESPLCSHFYRKTSSRYCHVEILF